MAALAALTVVLPLSTRPRGGAGGLEVRTDRGTLRLPLDRDGTYPLSGPLGQASLVVEGGEARVVGAPCPGKLCEGMGPIHRPGQAIVCAPNRILVRVEGEAPVDAVSR